ncbi:MAG: hypothetical protein AMXMBFR61_15570 [Fimbriimonadales bacterium]
MVLRIILWLFMVGVIIAAYLAPPARQFQVEDAARIIFFHVPAAISCVVFFVVGAFYAWRFLRRKQEMDDVKSLAAIEMGTLMCVLATITGSIFALIQWGSAWHWDPRETSIVAQLLIYAAYFALRASVQDARRRASLAAGYALFAIVTVPFLIFVAPRYWASLHPENTLVSSAGLDPIYRTVLWSSFAGYITIGLLIMRLRVRAGELMSRLESAYGLETGGHAPATHRLVGADGIPVLGGEARQPSREGDEAVT